MRNFIAAALLPLAALIVAAKPVDPMRGVPDEARRSIFQARATAICLGAMATTPEARPADSGRTCTCAAERFVSSRSATDLPPINAENFRRIMAAELAVCGGGEAAGDKTADITAAPVVEPAEPPHVMADSPGEKSQGGSMSAWFDGLNMPSLDNVPSWVWWAIAGLTIFLLFVRRISRGVARNDLDGPPRSMRVSAPAKPRHPNLPPRG